MLKFLSLPGEIQRESLEFISQRTRITPKALEKDLWVTAILNILFTLPYADKLVFKGGTSLSKMWKLITRFSEDIDISVDRTLFDIEGDVTKRQLKKLRKASSTFVRDILYHDLQKAISEHGLADYCKVEIQPDGEGDGTYPEPRKIFINYQSAPGNGSHSYIKDVVQLEIGARSLFEPAEKITTCSILSEYVPGISDLLSVPINTAVPQKTFLEKAFLIHELFTTDGGITANRKSRHLYDLEKMMDKMFAIDAVNDDTLWESIRHHREVFTPIRDVDYTPDVRDRIVLVPTPEIYDTWHQDYIAMQSTMIYGESLPFDKLIDRLRVLENRFHNRKLRPRR